MTMFLHLFLLEDEHIKMYKMYIYYYHNRGNMY